MQPRSMTSRKFCYLVVTQHVLPQKQGLPYPSVNMEKILCICLMTAIPYTYFPQLCKGASKVCIMKISVRNHEISRISVQTSTRNVYRAYKVPGMAEAVSQWHQTLMFLSVLKKKVWALSVISAFYCNTSTRETRMMQMLCQGFQSHLYSFTMLNHTTVTVRHKRNKAFFWEDDFLLDWSKKQKN